MPLEGCLHFTSERDRCALMAGKTNMGGKLPEPDAGERPPVGGGGQIGGKDEGWGWTGQPRILNRAGLMARSARGFLILQRLKAGYRREGAGWGWGFIRFEWAFCSNSLSPLAPGGAWPFPQALARRLPSTPPAWLGAHCRHLSPPTRSESSTLICLKHRALKCAFQGGLPAPIQRRRRVLGRGRDVG